MWYYDFYYSGNYFSIDIVLTPGGVWLNFFVKLWQLNPL